MGLGRFVLQATIGQTTQDKLRYLQDLLSHQIPSGDLGEVLDRTFTIAIRQLEKRKFAATSRPRGSTRASNGRHIPAAVKRTVWKRDGGQCTYVSPSGHRCDARRFLEFDHVREFACGGEATVAGIRLRCRAHNQFTAERAFGAEFMRERRETAARQRARAAAEARQGSERAKAS